MKLLRTATVGPLKAELYEIKPFKPGGLISNRNLKKYVGGQVKITSTVKGFMVVCEVKDIKLSKDGKFWQLEITPGWTVKSKTGLMAASNDDWETVSNPPGKIFYSADCISNISAEEEGELKFLYDPSDEAIVLHTKEKPFVDIK